MSKNPTIDPAAFRRIDIYRQNNGYAIVSVMTKDKLYEFTVKSSVVPPTDENGGIEAQANLASRMASASEVTQELELAKITRIVRKLEEMEEGRFAARLDVYAGQSLLGISTMRRVLFWDHPQADAFFKELTERSNRRFEKKTERVNPVSASGAAWLPGAIILLPLTVVAVGAVAGASFEKSGGTRRARGVAEVAQFLIETIGVAGVVGIWLLVATFLVAATVWLVVRRGTQTGYYAKN